MRKIISISCFCLLSILGFENFGRTQIVTIPDPNFVVFLQTNYPACITGDQLDTQCPQIVSETVLWLSGLNISDLTGIEHFTSLEGLICDDNQLTTLPVLPTGLVTLSVNNNLLTALVNVPNSVQYLFCSTNPLGTLPVLPPNLIHFYCAENNLTSLPELPNSIVELQCGWNSLTSLPTLPTQLNNLFCSDNLLASLPDLPDTMNMIWTNNNLLTSLPDLPNSLTQLLCAGNPGLACLPGLPENLMQTDAGWDTLGFPGTQITCVPNIPSIMSSSPGLTVCADGDMVNNPYGCDHQSGIYGNAYQDITGNCLFGVGDNLVTSAKFYLLNSLGDTLGISYNNWNAEYHFSNLPDGDYTVVLDTINMPYSISCNYPGIDSTVVILGGNVITNVDFEVSCSSTPGFDIGATSAVPSGWVFPDQFHNLTLFLGVISNYFGLDCPSAPIAGQIDVEITGPVTFSSSTISPTSITGNNLSYSITDFQDLFFGELSLVLQTLTTATIGDSVCVTISLTPTLGDNSPSNNNFSFCYAVMNSYDPNIKEVYPTAVKPNYNDWLTYTIHFQNTGNSPAFNIKLIDTLDALIKPNTFELLSYSHLVAVELSGHIATFKFNNIMLPDSASNPEGSIGYIQYRVKPQNNLPDGIQINNECYIYFDYNAPILTNTATTFYMEDLTVAELGAISNLNVYPNPSTGIFNFLLSENFENENTQIFVYNLAGEKVLDYFVTKSGFISIDITSEKSGIYFMTILNGEQIATSKLVKY